MKLPQLGRRFIIDGKIGTVTDYNKSYEDQFLLHIPGWAGHDGNGFETKRHYGRCSWWIQLNEIGRGVTPIPAYKIKWED